MTSDITVVEGKRISAKDDDLAIMRPEARRKKRTSDFFKTFLKLLFSQIGVIFLVVGYAVVGANVSKFI